MDHNDGSARSDGYKRLSDSPPKSRSGRSHLASNWSKNSFGTVDDSNAHDTSNVGSESATTPGPSSAVRSSATASRPSTNQEPTTRNSFSTDANRTITYRSPPTTRDPASHDDPTTNQRSRTAEIMTSVEASVISGSFTTPARSSTHRALATRSTPITNRGSIAPGRHITSRNSIGETFVTATSHNIGRPSTGHSSRVHGLSNTSEDIDSPEVDDLFVIGSASDDESTVSADTKNLTTRHDTQSTPNMGKLTFNGLKNRTERLTWQLGSASSQPSTSHYRPALESMKEDPEPKRLSQFVGRHASLRQRLDNLAKNKDKELEVIDDDKFLSKDYGAPLGFASIPLADLPRARSAKGKEVAREDWGFSTAETHLPRAAPTSCGGAAGACLVNSSTGQEGLSFPLDVGGNTTKTRGVPTGGRPAPANAHPCPETTAEIANLRRGPVIRFGPLPLAGKATSATDFGLFPPKEIRDLWPGIDRMRNLALALLAICQLILLSLVSSISVMLKGSADKAEMGSGVVVWAITSGVLLASSCLGLGFAIRRYVVVCRRAADGEDWIGMVHRSRPLPPPPPASPGLSAGNGSSSTIPARKGPDGDAAGKGHGQAEGGKVVSSVSRRELLQPEGSSVDAAETTSVGEGAALPRADTQASILTELCAAVTEGYSPLWEETSSARVGVCAAPPRVARPSRLAPRLVAASEEGVEMF